MEIDFLVESPDEMYSLISNGKNGKKDFPYLYCKEGYCDLIKI